MNTVRTKCRAVIALTWALASASTIAAPAPTSSDQGTIYRCVDNRGAVSFQTQACGAGQRTTATRSYHADRIDPALAERSRSIEEEMNERNRRAQQSPRYFHARAYRGENHPTECQTAKAYREKTLKQAGLKRTYDMLSKVDSAVWDACQGF